MKLHRMLGKNIRFWREARGFTQEELAFRAQTSSSYISKMELGKENPTITVLERIAKALAIDPCMLLLNTCRCAENAKKKQICDQQPVLCPDEFHRLFHQSSHTYGRFHVIGEYEEGTASSDHTTVERHTDTDTSH